MRLHFQEKPLDLFAAIGYTLVISAVLLALNAGNLLGILLVVFFPGYVLVAFFLPNNKQIDWIERIALSFGLSIAIVPLLGLLLNFTPWGIRFGSVVLTALVFTVGVGCAAYWRRMREPPETRLGVSILLTLPEWQEHSILEKSVTVGLAVGIVVAAGTLTYFVLNPQRGEPFTEFYILGPGSNASLYPTTMNASQPGTVILGIANHEAARVNYTVRVDLVGVRIAYNTSSRFNETFEVNRTTWSRFAVTLTDGENWTHPLAFWINYSGLWKIQFLLFTDGHLSNAYRELQFYVRVI